MRAGPVGRGRGPPRRARPGSPPGTTVAASRRRRRIPRRSRPPRRAPRAQRRGRSGWVICEVRSAASGASAHDAKGALLRIEAEHRRPEQRERHPRQPEAEREQREQSARSAEDVSDSHDAAHGLGGHRGRDEETAREPSGEPVARPPRDEQDDERAVEAVQEHVHVVVREGALLAGADLPERPPDHVRERPVRPDGALGRKPPEVASEGVQPAGFSPQGRPRRVRTGSRAAPPARRR